MQPGDVKVFFALHVAMGLVHKPNLKSYWSKDLVTQTPFFGEHMSLNSFELISQKTHFNNDSQIPPPGQPNHDPLAKVRHIVSTLQQTFCSALAPNRALGLDEATCAFHGVCRFHAFNLNKPDKYHLKLYAVSEADSGYCLGFEVSTGQERKADPANKVAAWPSVVSLVRKHHGISDNCMLKFGACPVMDGTQLTPVSEIVMQLMHKYGLLDQGYHLYTDNFYSSPHLATALLKWDTGFCGTVHRNKKMWPVALLKACGGKKDDVGQGGQKGKGKGKGKKSQNVAQEPKPKILKAHSWDIVWWRSQSNDLLAMAIGNRKVFHLVSTIHNATQSMVSIPREKKWDWQADAVLDYNYGMKAVDLGDKILKSYEMNQKTQKWTTKLVFHLGNMAMMNAYLLWRHSQQNTIANELLHVKRSAQVSRLTGNLNLLNHVEFHSTVVLALVAEGNRDHTFNNPAQCVLVLHPEQRFNDRHFPEEIVPKKAGGRKHHICTECHKKPKGLNTKFCCGACNKFLCAWPCFQVYHTKGLTFEDAIKARDEGAAKLDSNVSEDSDMSLTDDRPNQTI